MRRRTSRACSAVTAVAFLFLGGGFRWRRGSGVAARLTLGPYSRYRRYTGTPPPDPTSTLAKLGSESPKPPSGRPGEGGGRGAVATAVAGQFRRKLCGISRHVFSGLCDSDCGARP